MKKLYLEHFWRLYPKGFTLIELLVYALIFTVVAGLLTGILIMISRTQTREVASFELGRQLQFVTQRIQHAIRDASVVESVYGDIVGTPCFTHCSIRLRTRNSALDPTIISSDEWGVYIQEGSGPITALTTAGVEINSLRFTKTRHPEGLLIVNIDLAMAAYPYDPPFRVERHLASAVAHVSAATFSSDLLPDATGQRNVGGTTLRWNNLILSGGINIVGPESAGEQVGISMARGLNHGSSSISQYFITATPHNRFGQRYDIGGTPVLRLEGDMGQATRRAYFTSVNVGIGTTTPLTALDVRGALIVPSGLGNAAARPAVAVARIQGEIAGVGGTTPGLGWDDGFLRVSAGGGTNANTKSFIDLSGFSNVGDMHNNIVFGTAGTQRMRIDNAGNVGIGTAAPGVALDVRSGSIRTAGILSFTDPAGTPYLDNWIGRLNDGTVDWLHIGGITTGGVRRIGLYAGRVFFDGNVGIGTTAPGQRLQVGSSTVGGNYIQDAQVGWRDGYMLARAGTVVAGMGIDAGGNQLQLSTGSTFTPRITIDSAGNVGIGTTTPGTHRLHVVGTAGLTTGTAWTNTSDSRWKNIQSELRGSSLEKILALRPVSYEWNALHARQFGENPGLKYGFIAQEIKEVIPETTSQDADGFYWYNPSGMEAILTAAIQEQQKQIENLVKEVAALRAELNAR